MEAIDTVYEYAGYQAAASLHDALRRLGVPLAVALAGVAWRFLRTAEEGLARPLGVYFFSLMLVWWLASPVEVAASEGTRLRAPRFAYWASQAADLAVSRAVAALHGDFLARPFEWERIAALCGLARVGRAPTRENLQTFFRSCTRPALAALERPADPSVEDDPLGESTGLAYERFAMTWTDGREVGCEEARRALVDAVRRELDEPFHRAALEAMARYGPAGPDDLEARYVAQVIRNEWHGPPDTSEMAVVRAALGSYGLLAAEQNVFPLEEHPLVPRRLLPAANLLARDGSFKMALYAAAIQTYSTAYEAKERYYLATTLAPALYGLCLMLLLALFPIAALWALVPGRWSALVHFGKVLLSVKLWPLGWALLSTFTARRPISDAFHRPGQPPTTTEQVFIAAVMMYFLVPAIAFLIVHIAVAAGSLPFRPASPAPGPAVRLGSLAALARR